MKTVLIKAMAALLLVWYSMSIIGFDVHTCSSSGRSFVSTFIEGLTCEDIHPEHTCHAAECCEGDHCEDSAYEDVLIEANDCCSNDYLVLKLTGTLSAEDHDHYDECACGHCPCTGFCLSEAPQPCFEENLTAYIHEPDSGFIRACERQAALRVWRI